MTGSEAPPSFRLAYVPGVTPDKWVRIWNERLPDVPLSLTQVPAERAGGVLLADEADAGLVRLPVDRTVLSAIPLYTETTVVLIPRDHLVTAADQVTLDDLADEIVLHPLDDVLGWDELPGRPALERPATTADAVELVAAGIGVLLVPLSLARLHHRKDLTYRTVTEAPESSVALSWPEDAHTDRVEDFIGIVRGRTVNSTRGRQPEPARSKDGRAEATTPARRTPAGGGRTGGGKTGRTGGAGGAGGKTGGKQTGAAARRSTGGNRRGGSTGKGKGGGRGGRPRAR
ncbi:LysR substrate-binding domain-containing protein [Streptomyces sp. NPDC093065]|uniref:LysR substrate-binding domain-containing protein n=1 Tax=Streptomyces sp. NPDC093065 TaxID=3366021 RepID=UPI0037FE4721